MCPVDECKRVLVNLTYTTIFVEAVGPYQLGYNALADARSMRLLYLLPGASGSPLACRLETFRLETALSYEAMSYAWGDSDRNCHIMIDGIWVSILPNLHAALRRVRHATQERLLWADFICIDQSNFEGTLVASCNYGRHLPESCVCPDMARRRRRGQSSCRPVSKDMESWIDNHAKPLEVGNLGVKLDPSAFSPIQRLACLFVSSWFNRV